MKNVIYVVTIIIVLIYGFAGCTSDKESIQETHTTSSKEAEIDLKGDKSLHSLLKGTWILADYIEDLAKTKSPFQSSEKLVGITEITISVLPDSDTLSAGVGIDNHQGHSFHILPERGSSGFSFKTDLKEYTYSNERGFCEIEIKTKASDTTLYICAYGKNKALIKKIAFKRFKSKGSEASFSDLQGYVTNLLFSGPYTLFDSTNVASTVYFKENEELEGFVNYKTFFVTTDFVVRVENNLDNIIFCREERDCDTYLYKFEGDMIQLYRPVYVENEPLYDYGKLVYKLVKER